LRRGNVFLGVLCEKALKSIQARRARKQEGIEWDIERFCWSKGRGKYKEESGKISCVTRFKTSEKCDLKSRDGIV
jgi:hypothetical protein